MVMTNCLETLAQCRMRIDEIDLEITKLYEARMDVCAAVADYKREHNMPILQPERERSVIEKAKLRVENPFYMSGAARLFETLMAISRSLQQDTLNQGVEPMDLCPDWQVPARVAFPGAGGSFSEQAAHDYFLKNANEGATFTAFETFEQVACAVSEGKVDCALMPIENSTAGTVDETYRLIVKYGLHIVGEQIVDVRHHLLGIEGSNIEDIREVRSHPQAIEQCRAFLKDHPDMRIVPMENTALSAMYVRDEHNQTIAAIASIRAAAAYGLMAIEQDIHDVDKNSTRFVVLAKEPMDLNADKASVIFTLENEVGALSRVIGAFAGQGINLCHLESRPIPDTPWAYRFYADLEWGSGRQALIEALSQAHTCTHELTLLGLYKRWEEK